MQNYLEESSMFPEDLFTVVVLRRPVASGLSPCVDNGAGGQQNPNWYRLDGLNFFLKKIYKDFICKFNCVTCIIFAMLLLLLSCP